MRRSRRYENRVPQNWELNKPEYGSLRRPKRTTAHSKTPKPSAGGLVRDLVQPRSHKPVTLPKMPWDE